MRKNQARPSLLRAALAALTLAAASTAGAQLTSPTAQRPAATPADTPDPYAHNEQGNFRTCAAVDLAMDQPPAPACRADWDTNSAVDSRDVSAFMQTWIRDAGAGTTAADFNADGQITSADLSAFLSAWIDETTGGC